MKKIISIMKKIYILVLIPFICFLAACNSTKEYNGPKITKLTYTSIDYNGGFTIEHELDFNDNTYSSVGYLPDGNENPKPETKSTFTDEAEKVFMDSCYTYGLFDLKESYSATGIIDGGGWNLMVYYEDGTSKASKGDNAGPTKIFNKCAPAFYDLCGQAVVGRLPDYYVSPPNISYSFQYTVDTTIVNTNELARVVRANYKWNNSESLKNDYYLLNEANKDKNQFVSNYTYQLDLYTSNYDCDERFNKLIVKEYDFNSDLTNEKTIYTGKWIKQIELDIQFNKIYVYELAYKDGDFVQYTFSTYCNQ